MAPTSAQIRQMVSQFVALTGASERQAARFLQANKYKPDVAIDEYLNSTGDSAATAKKETELKNMFEEIRDSNKDEKTTMGLESTMEYYQNTLGVSLEDAELFVVQELLQAPSIGEITKEGYVNGWKKASADTTHEAHANYVKSLVGKLPKDQGLFRTVYKYAFVTGKENDQKSLSLENAVIYWKMLFSPPGMPWETRGQNWLELWQEFLKEKWTRSVNRDMWNMTLEFAFKSMQDPTLSFWNEDGAWPTVIDDFVEWCREKGVTKAEGMDVDN